MDISELQSLLAELVAQQKRTNELLEALLGERDERNVRNLAALEDLKKMRKESVEMRDSLNRHVYGSRPISLVGDCGPEIVEFGVPPLGKNSPAS